MSKLKGMLIAMSLTLFSASSFAATSGVTLADKLTSLVGVFPVVLAAILSLVGALNVIAALTATKKDDKIVHKVKTFLIAVAGFWNKLAPKDDQVDLSKYKDKK